MCGTYAWAPWRLEENLLCMDAKCNKFGETVVPWDVPYVAPLTQLYGYSAVSTQPYQPKEQDMCSENSSWNLTIMHIGNNQYAVEISRRGKKDSDKLTREFENFDDALTFATDTYEELS
jgi:hypothetical protein